MAEYYWVKLELIPLDKTPSCSLPREKNVSIEIHKDPESGQLYGFVVDSRIPENK